MASMDNIKNTEEALLRITDCNLATVCDMASTSQRKRKGEYSRQISIAQEAIVSIEEFSIKVPEGSRIESVINKYNSDVRAWADYWTEKFCGNK